jgi:hypothetical protein
MISAGTMPQNSAGRNAEAQNTRNGTRILRKKSGADQRVTGNPSAAALRSTPFDCMGPVQADFASISYRGFMVQRLTLKLSASLPFGKTCNGINQLTTHLDLHVQ